MELKWFSSGPRQRYQRTLHSDPDEIVAAPVLHGGLSEDEDPVSDNSLVSPRLVLDGEVAQVHRSY